MSIKNSETLEQTLILAMLAKGNKVRNVDIVKELIRLGNKEKSAPILASRATKSLRADGLIERHGLEDKKAPGVEWSITERGREWLIGQATHYVMKFEALSELLRPFKRS